MVIKNDLCNALKKMALPEIWNYIIRKMEKQSRKWNIKCTERALIFFSPTGIHESILSVEIKFDRTCSSMRLAPISIMEPVQSVYIRCSVQSIFSHSVFIVRIDSRMLQVDEQSVKMKFYLRRVLLDGGG